MGEGDEDRGQSTFGGESLPNNRTPDADKDWARQGPYRGAGGATEGGCWVSIRGLHWVQMAEGFTLNSGDHCEHFTENGREWGKANPLSGGCGKQCSLPYPKVILHFFLRIPIWFKNRAVIL